MKNIRIKVLALILIVCIAIQLTSCEKNNFEFLHESSEISSIEIVESRFDWEQNNYYANTLVRIDDKDSFLSELNGVAYRSSGIFAPVYSFSDSDIGIKIMYLNGDFEVIYNKHGRVKYTTSDNVTQTDNTGSFDGVEYNALLEKYFALCDDAKFYLMHNRTDIISIEIVDASYEFDQEIQKGTYKRMALANVDDIDAFLDKLNSIEYKYTLKENDRKDSIYKSEHRNAVKITYINGDFEVIDNEWRELYIEAKPNKDVPCAYIGEFDKEAFDALLNEYLI